MNDFICKSLAVCRYQIRDKIFNKRSLLFFVLIFSFIFLQLDRVRHFANITSVKITPWCFPFISSDWSIQMVITSIYVWYVSVISKNKVADKYIYYRTGMLIWENGTCVTIFFSTALYVISLLIFSVLSLIPYLKLCSDWGVIWNTLCITDATTVYNISINVNPIIVHLYKPNTAMFLSTLLQFFSLCLIGFIQYYFNKLTKWNIGSYISIILVLLDVFLSNTSLEKYYMFSPITLSQLGNYNVASIKYGYNMKYSILFYSCGIIIIYILILFQKDRRVM